MTKRFEDYVDKERKSFLHMLREKYNLNNDATTNLLLIMLLDELRDVKEEIRSLRGR